ncbi:MAG: aldehyde dehydrogenase family protein, partial [Jatrophihabitans sp.]|uniref:aldehyde dehydrogenase family protein n=1 Tax=Jatrophihabitans sp. TaxID=1932789 RepID=UPI003F81F768
MPTIPDIDPEAVSALPLLASSTGGATTQVFAPYDGSLLGAVPSLDAATTEAAVAIARRALDGGPLPQWRRAEILDRAADGLVRRAEQFARCIALEAAKPIRTARVEVERAVSTLRFSAAAARHLTGEMVPLEACASGQGRLGINQQVSVGGVGGVAGLL